MSTTQILVIEDNLDAARQIVSLCFQMGCEPLLARDGFTGMLLALRTRPCLIISDVETPGLDGFEIVRRVRKHPELNHTTVVALSNIAPRKPATGQVPFDDYVLKSNLIQQLTSLIVKHCPLPTPSKRLARAV